MILECHVDEYPNLIFGCEGNYKLFIIALFDYSVLMHVEEI